MNILFIAAEMTPLVKVGGLADVVGALPAALQGAGDEARVLLPKYGGAKLQDVQLGAEIAQVNVPWQGTTIIVKVVESTFQGTVIYLLDAPEIFGSDTVYYEHSSGDTNRKVMERFVFFSWAAAYCVPRLGWSPDVIHCHDWHAASFVAWNSIATPNSPIATILTIHNMEGQGKWNADEIFSWLGLTGQEAAWMSMRDGGGDLNLLQLGVRLATKVNTVSPTYAHEILTPEFSQGLDGDLASRPDGVSGILNGLDVIRFDPEHDSALSQTYSVDTVLDNKKINKAALQTAVGLPVDATVPLFGVVSRLTTQKGLDLVVEDIATLDKKNIQLVILGSGQPAVEKQLAAAAQQFPWLKLIITFDPVLAQKIYGGADFFLMPSRFEPCGLGQMIAMRYGTLPVVRATGGLRDTVPDIRQDPRAGTGFSFSSYTAQALAETIDAAIALYRQPEQFWPVVQRAMQRDLSWNVSATAYHHLYAQTKR